jgi:hypothetical protein
MAFGMGFGLGSSLSSVGVRGTTVILPNVQLLNPCTGKSAAIAARCQNHCGRMGKCVLECYGENKNGRCMVKGSCQDCPVSDPLHFETL